MKLEQKQGSRRKVFELEGDQLKYRYKSLNQTEEWIINLESIGNEIKIERYSRLGPLILGIIFSLLGLFVITAMLIAPPEGTSIFEKVILPGIPLLLGIVCIRAPMTRDLHIVGGYNKLTFYLESPSREEVERFANELIKRAREITLERMAKVDSEIPEHAMMGQLAFLKAKGILTEQEYELKKQEYHMLRLLK